MGVIVPLRSVHAGVAARLCGRRLQQRSVLAGMTSTRDMAVLVRTTPGIASILRVTLWRSAGSFAATFASRSALLNFILALNHRPCRYLGS